MGILLIWLAQFIVSEEELETAGLSAISKTESEQRYAYINTMALTCAVFAVPTYGYLTDKLATGSELLVAYGTRCIAGFAFYAIKNPNSEWITWTVVFFMLASNFEEVCMESLFSKRLPGDIRAAMVGLQGFFGKFGHFVFAAFAIMTVEKFGIKAGLLMVALFDLSMVVLITVVACCQGFKNDPAAGEEALEQGKAKDAADLAAAKEKEKLLTEEIARLRAEVTRLRKKVAELTGVEYGPETDEADGADTVPLGDGSETKPAAAKTDDQTKTTEAAA